MDLNLKNKSFLICGASSGFGEATARNLIEEGANLIAVARNPEGLQKLKKLQKDKITIFEGDITKKDVIDRLFKLPEIKKLSGALINASGPPALKFHETTIEDWDNAYAGLLRWKILITKQIVPVLQANKYGRILYVESSSVKQPIDNLVLSTSMRLAVVGMVKSLSQNLIREGITLNILAPGYHATRAVDRIIKKNAETGGTDYNDAREKIESNIPAGKMGDPMDFGKLATWLFSEHSGYISGQTISVDGGMIKNIFG